MNNLQKEFVMELFLDNDNVSTMNRLVIAVANVVNENSENLVIFNEIMKQEYALASQIDPADSIKFASRTLRMRGFFEQIISNYSDEEYRIKFKTNKSTVELLLKFLKSIYVKPSNITIEKKVHVFLWLLLNDCSYNDTGKLFGLHKSSVSYIFHEIASLLIEHRYNFISWPSVEEQHLTRIKVNSRYNLPNCVGFIDACRLLVGSKRNKRDKQGILLLQAVCDESLLFIDVYVGEIGKTRKGKVFRDSTLSRELKNFVDFDNHILGDSEYRLRKNLITPFSSEELLTCEEMKFNEVHWKTRSYIGHAFELLKERFRKLNHIDIVKPESVEMLVLSACILHNFIIMHEGCSEVKEEMVTCEDGVTMNTNIIKSAIEKRQFLSNYVNYIDSDSCN